MSQPDGPRRRATYADVLAAPEHVVAEIVDGQLYTWPRPGPRHADASSGLGGALRGPFDRGRGGSGGWRILDEPELHLGEDIVVPDLAGWRRDRLPHLPEQAYFVLAPDWICEVLFPTTALFDRVKKLAVYARSGVRHVWLVDPVARIVEALRLESGRWTIVSTHGGNNVIHAEPFDALALDLTLLWDEPGPS